MIVIAPTFEKHLVILQEVLHRLSAAGLTLNKVKWNFCKAELNGLSCLILVNGWMEDPEKVEALIQILPPTNMSEVGRIIGQP